LCKKNIHIYNLIG